MTGIDRLGGLICPMVTPFDEQGQIDLKVTASLIDYLIEHGVHNLFVGGSTGEVLYLELEERKSLCAFVIEHVADRIPVIIQTGTAATHSTIELTLHARQMGATAAAVLVPYYYRYDEDSLFTHYVTLAEAASDFPLFIYMFPDLTGNDISPALLKRICAAAPNVVGMKVSDPDLMRFQKYLDVVKDDFLPFCGVDGLTLPALSIGSQGQVSGNANVFPEPFLELLAAFKAGDMKKANQAQQLINQITAVLNEGRNLAFFKEALALRGIPVGGVRSPMRALTQDERKSLEQGLRRLALI